MIRCPACGFESPDTAQWCDFCKEPFRKAPQPKPGIPPEFLALDTGGKITSTPPWLRYAAWSVLAAWLIAILALMGAYLAKQRSQQQDQPFGRSTQSR